MRPIAVLSVLLVLLFPSLQKAHGSSSRWLAAEHGHELPLQVSTEKRGESVFTFISASLDHPYNEVRRALASGENLCDIAPLHFNIKACTYRAFAPNVLVTFFSGRKHYQAPEKARSYTFRYRVVRNDGGRFEGQLVALGEARRYTTEPLMLEATPRAGGTDIRVRLSYRDNFWLRLAAEGYFATLGRGKTGFSVTGRDAAGSPIRIDGVEGALERNAARYYFALDAFLATRGISEPARFESRLSQWFDRTERFGEQLHEMDKDSYLSFKRQERADQLRLQNGIFASDG